MNDWLVVEFPQVGNHVSFRNNVVNPDIFHGYPWSLILGFICKKGVKQKWLSAVALELEDPTLFIIILHVGNVAAVAGGRPQSTSVSSVGDSHGSSSAVEPNDGGYDPASWTVLQLLQLVMISPSFVALVISGENCDVSDWWWINIAEKYSKDDILRCH